MSTVGSFIASERERMGITLRDLAQRLGLTAVELGEIERSKKHIGEKEAW